MTTATGCTHDLAECETACADGMCPMCLAVHKADLLTALKILYDACELVANEEGGDFGPIIGPAAEIAEAAIDKFGG